MLLYKTNHQLINILPIQAITHYNIANTNHIINNFTLKIMWKQHKITWMTLSISILMIRMTVSQGSLHSKLFRISLIMTIHNIITVKLLKEWIWKKEWWVILKMTLLLYNNKKYNANLNPLININMDIKIKQMRIITTWKYMRSMSFSHWINFKASTSTVWKRVASIFNKISLKKQKDI